MSNKYHGNNPQLAWPGGDGSGSKKGAQKKGEKPDLSGPQGGADATLGSVNTEKQPPRPSYGKK